MATDLKNTIMVDNEEYNINAVEAEHAKQATNANKADDAKKVQNKLILTKTNLTKDQETGEYKESTILDFNGETQKSLKIVPADGGRFSGRITVNNVESSTLTRDDETVLNYHDILGIVIPKLLSTSTLYNWDPDKLTNKFTPNVKNGTISGIGIVQGPEIAINGNEGFATNNELNGWLPAYLYICSDSPHNIYFGTSGSASAIKLSTEATTLTGIITNGDKKTYDVQDIYDLNTAINKIVAESDSNKVNNSIKAEQLIFTDGSDKSALTAMSISNSIESVDEKFTEKIEDILDGTSTVGKATKDSEGADIRKNYYRSASNTTNANTITISTSGPSGGNIGDIWIQYSN